MRERRKGVMSMSSLEVPEIHCFNCIGVGGGLNPCIITRQVRDPAHCSTLYATLVLASDDAEEA